MPAILDVLATDLSVWGLFGKNGQLVRFARDRVDLKGFALYGVVLVKARAATRRPGPPSGLLGPG
jgi:hypothetical protein